MTDARRGMEIDYTIVKNLEVSLACVQTHDYLSGPMSVSSITFTDTGKVVRVAKIFCLGRNYPEHAREMHAEVPKTPVVFLKPSTAIIHSGEDVILPSISRVLHFESEMVVIIGTGGRNIAPDRAYGHVAGYAVGLDMTLRDVQSEAKKKGLPWTVAKGFDTSAPVSDAVDRTRIPDPHRLQLTMKVNGELRQNANTGTTIFRIDQIVSYLSTIFTLEEGDLIFTGTPEGVGAVKPGDMLEAELESVGRITVGVR